MSAHFTSPAEHLQAMRDTVSELLYHAGSDDGIMLAVLTYRHILGIGQEGEDAVDIVDRVTQAVDDMRLEAFALPDGSPKQIARGLVAAIGQAVIDADSTTVLR